MTPRITATPKELICRNCGASNPLKTYCCLNCFKVLRPKAETPFWQIYIQPTPAILGVVFVAFISLLFVAKRWMDSIEAQVTMNLTSADYNLKVIAEKKKKASFFHVKSKTKTPVAAVVPEETSAAAQDPLADPQ